MKNKRYIDKIRRINYKNNELKARIYKILFLQIKKLNLYYMYFNNKNKNISNFKNRIKNRCIITGRSFSVDNKFKVSRIFFKKLVDSSNLSGFYKDSW